MKKFEIILSTTFLLFIISFINLLSQDIEPGNKITVRVNAVVKKINGNSFKYNYTLYNKPTSIQKVWEFSLIIHSSKDSIKDANHKFGWYGPYSHIDQGYPNWVSWGSDSIHEIAPGKIEKDFSFTSVVLPGITEYYAEGAHKIPSFDEGMAQDSIPGYDDLTPYGSGIIGKTVGPVLIKYNNILDSLVTYNSQSFNLGWIKTQLIKDKYNNYLTNAKTSLQQNKFVLARCYLQNILTGVDKDSSSTIKSEAYALLRYNAEYLLAKLSKSILK